MLTLKWTGHIACGNSLTIFITLVNLKLFQNKNLKDN